MDDMTTIAGWIEPNNQRLYEDLASIDPTLPALLARVVSELLEFDSTLVSAWETEGIAPKIGTYLLRYVTPAYELLGSDGQRAYETVLGAELLSVCAWRAFDNCMDAHVSHKISHLASLLGFSRLNEFSQKYWPNRDPQRLLSHYVEMSDCALNETETPVAITDIWKRCSVLLYPLESLTQLSPVTVNIFKSYINISGLAHDIDDFFTDLTSDIVSWPVAWFREISVRGRLNIDDIEQVYRRSQDAARPLEEYFASLNVTRVYPLLARLLQDAATVIHHTR